VNETDAVKAAQKALVAAMKAQEEVILRRKSDREQLAARDKVRTAEIWLATAKAEAAKDGEGGS
jgi:hypothetical protein